MEIVQDYSGHGRSVLDIAGRDVLNLLMVNVEAKTNFTALLVYNVSRWGRFQDADESVYYGRDAMLLNNIFQVRPSVIAV